LRFGHSFGAGVVPHCSRGSRSQIPDTEYRRYLRYDLLILDDVAYVTKDQAETSVLFELIAARYERRSMLITANQPFGEWGKIALSITPRSWR
jgi:DNA replication protein DnaC